MASLRPRDTLKTKWQVRYRDRSREPAETTDSIWKKEHAPAGEKGYTKREAEREADWRQQLYDRGRYDPWTQDEPGTAAAAEGPVPLKRAAEIYLEEKKQMGQRGETGGWSTSTYKSDAPIIRRFAREAGAQLLCKNLRTSHIHRFVYGQDLAQATKRGYHRRVRAFVRWMEREGLVTEAPEMPPVPKKHEKMQETLTPEELEGVIRAHRAIPQTSDWHPHAWRIMFFQGFRSGEMIDLRVRNIDTEEGLIQVGDLDTDTKNRADRKIPLTEPARPYVIPFLLGLPWSDGEPIDRSSDERLFRCSPDSWHVSRSFKRAVRQAAKSPDEEDAHFKEGPLFSKRRAERMQMYTLRHSCATYWLKQGRSLIWVNQLLRHKTTQTTMKYVHLAGVDLADMQ